jgi:hypothetical protein
VRCSRLLAPLLLLELASGCDPPPAALCYQDSASAVTSAIVNGQPDTRHVAVGRLASGCTATLVGARTVLTAAHCIAGSSEATVQLAGKEYASRRVVVHPKYGVVSDSYDLGLVLLESAPGGVPPIPLALAPPAVGDALTLLGFGITAAGRSDDGTRRSATNTIAGVRSLSFTYCGSSGGVGNICTRDSGGPSLRETSSGSQELLGVHSTGSDPCGSEGNDVRVDVLCSFLVTESAGDLSGFDASAPLVAQCPAAGQRDPGIEEETVLSCTAASRFAGRSPTMWIPPSLPLLLLLAGLALLRGAHRRAALGVNRPASSPSRRSAGAQRMKARQSGRVQLTSYSRPASQSTFSSGKPSP